jgi:hypothetical protein
MPKRKIIRTADGKPLVQAETKRKCLTCGTTLSSYNPGPYCYAHTDGMPVKEHYPVSKVHSRVVPKVAEDANIHSSRDEFTGYPQPKLFTEEVTGVVIRNDKSGEIWVEDIEDFFGLKSQQAK